MYASEPGTPIDDTHPLPHPLTPTLKIRLAYYAGQLGWSIASFGVMNLLFYLFDSNVINGERMFPALLPSIGLLAVIAGVSRLFDAVTDPLIASFSDRSKHRLGRLRVFMAVGGLPFILFSVLVFLPITHQVSWLNSAWLMVAVVLFYFFMTVYITPYFALIAELGHNAKGRLKLSTGVALAWAAGFLIGNTVYVLQGLLEQAGFESLPALQLCIGLFAVIALVLVYLPVFIIDERKYCHPHTSELSTFKAMRSCFSNRYFRLFVGADFAYFIALTFLQSGISFYIIMLLDLDKAQATTFMTLLFVISFVLYGPIAKLATKFGKKPVILLSFSLLIAGVGSISLWGLLPMDQTATMITTLVLMIFPVSAFGFMFYAVVGDIAEADGKATGHYKEGMFYGTRTFMNKSGTAVALTIFPLVSHFGSSSDAVTETGIRFTLLIALVALSIGMFLFSRYDEKSVQAQLSE